MLMGMLLSIVGVIVAVIIMFIVYIITEVLGFNDNGFLAAICGIVCIIGFLAKALSII